MQMISKAALLTAAPLSITTQSDEKSACEEMEDMPPNIQKEILDRIEKIEDRLTQPAATPRANSTLVLSLIISAVSVVIAVLSFATAATRNNNADVSAFAAWQAEVNVERRQNKEKLDKLESDEAKKRDATMEGILNWLESQPQNRTRVRVPRRTSRLKLEDLHTNGNAPFLKTGYQ